MLFANFILSSKGPMNVTQHMIGFLSFSRDIEEVRRFGQRFGGMLLNLVDPSIFHHIMRN
jgi:hypothetical protein